MAAKPVIRTMIRTEFGDVLESEAFQAANGPNGDFTYVPGYSDLRRTRDTELGEVAQGKRSPNQVSQLPVRLQWVRHAKYSGQPDNRKTVEFNNVSYRAVTSADLGQSWFTSMPEGAVTGPGGEIRTGDCTLMVTDAKNAARQAAAIRIRTENMSRQDASAAPLMKLGATKPGSDPNVEAKPGETIRAGSAIKGK